MFKLGVGLYRHMLTADYFRFARQIGCTDVVVHLVDYFHSASGLARDNQPTGSLDGIWGEAGHSDECWTLDFLQQLKLDLAAHGLRLAAIENFDPAHWYDILLDGARRDEQIAHLQGLIRIVGAAGIPCIGYNFSLAGVTGRFELPRGRGDAITVGLDGPFDEPMPPNTIWNMTLPAGIRPEPLHPPTHEQLWDRLQRFLRDLCPVAELAGVQLAAHPDDPPLPTMRRQPRLVYQPAMYQRLIDTTGSPSNMLELCVGTLGEMSDGGFYEAIENYLRQGRVAYVHLRNVRGTVPHYTETFIDDGEIDMLRILELLARYKFEGVVIPDHTPRTTCEAPWHAGMAHTLGFMAAARAMLSARFP